MRSNQRRLLFRLLALLGGLSVASVLSMAIWPVLRNSEFRRWFVRFQVANRLDLSRLPDLPNKLWRPPADSAPGIMLQGHVIKDDTGQFLYSGNSIYRIFYPDNPQGHFRPVDPEELALTCWALDWTEGLAPHRTLTRSGGALVAKIELDPPAAFVTLNGPNTEVPAGAVSRLLLRVRADVPHDIVAVWSTRQSATEGRRLVVPVETTWSETTLSTPVFSEATTVFWRVFPHVDYDSVEFEKLLLLDSQNRPLEFPGYNFFVEYTLNSYGNRDVERPLEKPPGVVRIGCVGDSFTYGGGVQVEDTFALQLERLLTEQTAAANTKYEVINFGVSGSSPGEQLEKLRNSDVQFHPDIILLSLCHNDYFERKELFEMEQRLGAGTQQVIQELGALLRNRGFSACLKYIEGMNAFCLERGIRFAVGCFQNNDGDEWERLDVEVSAGLAKLNIPYINVRPQLLAAGVYGKAGMMYPPSDPHPNVPAHRIYAEAWRDMLQNAGWLEPRP